MTDPHYPCLSGRHVLVTGGASGIGAAEVEAFARQGASVAFLDIDAAAAEALVARLDGRARFHRCDITDIAALRATIAAIEAEWGAGADVLVNNAANDARHKMSEVEPEYWRHVLALNLDHQFFATQAVAPGMAARGGGAVILTGSISWMRARPGMVGYTTAKAGIAGLTRTMARELGGQKIRVNCLVPGAIRTERQARLWRSPETDAQILELQALKTVLVERHVAAMALFLGSSQSDGCTGAEFKVDAGLTLN